MSIVLHDITYYHPDQTLLFRHLNCSIESGQHVNLIGNNGAGKSTLLRIIAGQIIPASGSLTIASTPYYVPQQINRNSAVTVAMQLDIDKQLAALQAILTGNTDEIYFEQLADRWDIEERAKQALRDWQLNDISLDQPMAQLSGGEQTRLMLAGMQLHEPAIILLDEPTNHLDVRGRLQLCRFLEKFKGTMVVVSHDRSLLELNNTTLVLSNGKLNHYGGNYSFYKAQHEEQLNALQQDIHHREKELKLAKKQAQIVKERRQKREGRDKKESGLPKILVNTRKNNAEVSTARLQNAHTEKIAEINNDLRKQHDLLEKDQLLQLHFPDSTLHRGKILVHAKDINYAYDDLPLWKKSLTFDIKSGDRITIRGNNGSGKTTLLKLILGTLQPSTGELYRTTAETIYLDQHYSFIDGNKTVFEQLDHHNHQRLPEHSLKTLLHQHQFDSEQWNKKCAQLSGGEKMKLTICCLFVANAAPDIIMLDEPGNNLDIKSLEVLIKALKGFHGTLLLISHDPLIAEELQIPDYIDLSA